MRKVLFKKWIPTGWEEIEGRKFRKDNTSCWEKDFTNQGLFHQWAPKYEEYDNGAGNYIVALVELQDGTIEEVLPINLKFEDIPLYIKYSTVLPCEGFEPNIGLTSGTTCKYCGQEKWEHIKK